MRRLILQSCVTFRLSFQLKLWLRSGCHANCCNTVAMPVYPCLHSQMSETLACIIGASGVMLAACEPHLPESMDQSEGIMDWRFWMVLAILVVMTGRQVSQDVLALSALVFPAMPVTPEAVPSVAVPGVLANLITAESTSGHENSLSMPAIPDNASPSAGSMPPPTVPILVSRFGEKYHYNKECSGLLAARQVGIESRTLCKICDVQRRR